MILTVRGMGEPLCATYARSYLVHKILQVMPYGAWGSPELIKDVHEPLWDTFTVLKQQLASEARPALQPMRWGLQPRALGAATPCTQPTTPRVTQPATPRTPPAPPRTSQAFLKGIASRNNLSPSEYFTTLVPALEWLMQCAAEQDGREESLGQMVRAIGLQAGRIGLQAGHIGLQPRPGVDSLLLIQVRAYRTNCKSTLVLNAVLGAFDPALISKNALAMCTATSSNTCKYGYRPWHVR